jgi:putative addiction module component (TIGR02574 family)
MARIAAGIPHHITQRGNRRHGSGNEYGVPGILELGRLPKRRNRLCPWRPTVVEIRHDTRSHQAMTRSQALLEEVESLPIDERLMLVDQLLRSLHGTGSGNDRKWLVEANKRLRDVKAGRVKTIPGREVLAEARRRLK